MSQHGDDVETGDGDPGPSHEDRDKHRALTAVLKDALHHLDTTASDIRREVKDFFECLESYFTALGVDDLEDGVDLHEKTRLRLLNATLGPKAKADLEGIPDDERDTYETFKKTIEERYLPPEDDVGSLCVLRRCTMREDEKTKDFVARLRALVARLSDLPEPWKIKAVLASMCLSHKNSKVRDLLAEKQPSTIQEAERLVEAYEIHARERSGIDKFNAALGGSSNMLPVDGVARGYWTRGGSTTVSSGRPCSNPACSLRRCRITSTTSSSWRRHEQNMTGW
jgi:hypothetical protein